MTGVRLRI